MSDLYRELMLDHARHPRGFGDLYNASFRHSETNAACGDRLDVAVRVDEDGRVAAVGFTGSGCVVSMATASMLTESLVGTPVVNLPELGLPYVEALVAAPVTITRTRCALLALRAIQRGYVLWKTV